MITKKYNSLKGAYDYYIENKNTGTNILAFRVYPIPRNKFTLIIFGGIFDEDMDEEIKVEKFNTIEEAEQSAKSILSIL